MTTVTASEAGESLLKIFETKDVQKSYQKIIEYRESMKDPNLGADYVLWISEPANLSKLHASLTENLEIPQKVMAIRRALMSRTQRAMLLTQAMELAVKKVHKL